MKLLKGNTMITFAFKILFLNLNGNLEFSTKLSWLGFCQSVKGCDNKSKCVGIWKNREGVQSDYSGSWVLGS